MSNNWEGLCDENHPLYAYKIGESNGKVLHNHVIYVTRENSTNKVFILFIYY